MFNDSCRPPTSWSNFTPRVMEQFGFDWDRVHSLNDR